MMSASQEHQGEKRKACVNPGNPVFSCMMAAADVLPALRANHPLFRTTSSEYGRLPPSFESSPCTFHPRSNKFSKDLIKSGMYRDNSFNTALDRGRVYDSPHLQHTL